MKNTSRIFTLLTVIMLVCTMVLTMAGCKNNTGNNNLNGSNNGNNNNQSATSAPSTYPTQLYDKNGNEIQMPDDNDADGWFSVEVINQYSMAPFVQPPDTKVVSKPQRDCLYLKGGEDVLQVCAKYAFRNIVNNNTAVYLPVMSTDDNGTTKAIDFNRIYAYDFSALYPTGDETSVTFVYTIGHKIYECALSLDSSADASETQICIAFADRTELYNSLI